MTKNYSFIGLFILFVCSFTFIQGQELGLFGNKLTNNTVQNANKGFIRCASTEYENYLIEKYKKATKEEFEEWIAPQVKRTKLKMNSANAKTDLLTIPVVVHVIHKGTRVGNGANISDERVLSQIAVLNEDFQRMEGTRGYNDNPLGTNAGIQFVLARVDPSGRPTNGINRVSMSYIWKELNVETILKPRTQWNPDKYFNIWVCEFGGDLEWLLGYAQFPEASGLQGLSGPYVSGTDGVIIDWRSFGTSDKVPATSEAPYFPGFDKGRTLTHEMGHALGLIHIWGDNNICIVDSKDSYNDYCLDTPAAANENYGCPLLDSCPNDPEYDMIENYMDYTDDTCMNLFTNDQKARMITVLNNSSRRASLLTSDVLEYKDSAVGEIESYMDTNNKEYRIDLLSEGEYAVEYKVFNSNGALTRWKKDSGKYVRIDTGSLAPGIYNVRLETNKRVKKIRFIVVK